MYKKQTSGRKRRRTRKKKMILQFNIRVLYCIVSYRRERERERLDLFCAVRAGLRGTRSLAAKREMFLQAVMYCFIQTEARS